MLVCEEREGEGSVMGVCEYVLMCVAVENARLAQLLCVHCNRIFYWNVKDGV